jgi:predicted site-specific integrase-resolvase
MSLAVKKRVLKRWRRDGYIHDLATREHERRVVDSFERWSKISWTSSWGILKSLVV